MISEIWNTVAAGKETTLEQRARARLAASYTADSARQAMDLVYHHGGSTSFNLNPAVDLLLGAGFGGNGRG